MSSHDLPWIFSDIDGTLVPPGREMSARTREAIRRYSEAGGRITLATGRHILAIRALVRELGLKCPQLSGNGSVVTEDGVDRLLFGIADHVQAAVASLLTRRIPHVLYTISGLYTRSPDVTPRDLEILVSIFHDYQPVQGDPPDPEAAFKILTFVDEGDDALEGVVRELARQAGLKSVRAGPHFLEMISEASGKGQAMELLLRESAWPRERTVAIGDSENDLSMFSRAGASFAVANASPEALEAAGELLPPVTEDGAAVLIERLLRG